jgi:hypothetical protein
MPQPLHGGGIKTISSRTATDKDRKLHDRLIKCALQLFNKYLNTTSSRKIHMHKIFHKHHHITQN